MDANVLEALDRSGNAYKRPALSNIIIYGRVRCIINKPDILGSGIKESGGNFAILDAYALKCLGEDYFRENSSYDVNSIYFTKGSILIYIDDTSWVGRDVKVFGKTKSYGATIRRQDSSKRDVGITAFVFGSPESDGRKKVFPLLPNAIVGLTEKDPDARGTALEDFIVLIASKKGDIPYPETLDGIIPYTGTDVYDEIVLPQNNDNLVLSSKPDKPPQEGILEAEEGSYISSGERVDISKIDMHLTFHLEGQERSEYFEPFKEEISKSAESRDAFVTAEKETVSSLMREYPLDDLNILNRAFVDRVVANPQRRLGGYATIKCKNYTDTFLNSCLEGLCLPENEASLFSKVAGSTKQGIEKMKKAVLVDPDILLTRVGSEEDADLDSIPVLKHIDSFAINIVGTCTGIGYSTLKNNMIYCFRRLGISFKMWSYMLFKTPYLLGLMGTGLSLVDCDTIYYSIGIVFGANEIADNERYRAYLVHLDTLNNCSNGNYYANDKTNRGINTFVKISDYKNADLAYPSKSLGYLKNSSFMVKPDVKDALEVLLEEDLSLSKSEITKLTGKHWYSDEYFSELCEGGIINTLDGFCALERNIECEFLIYEVFEKMGKLTTGISDATIEEVISSFEADRGFKLEGLQRDGIKLCKYRAGVLSGCAGSGKTTTSDCMTEVLKTLGDDINIVYCTPTGKACRRLAEVVHSTVRTIHSQFGVGMGGTSYVQSAYRRSKKPDNDKPVIYILDEMAMCNTNLMYNIAKNVSDKDMIYFLGDIKQLPPIGGGCPFKILMSILPCVELGVSKRAAEGSLVNYNTSLINFMSTPYCRELMYDGKTFIAKDCSDLSIVSEVKNAFLGFLDGTLNGIKYREDDIQVISGYQARTKLSSTARLNEPLQEALREKDRVLYYRESRGAGSTSCNYPYYQNDRVIYINKNSYDICRYAYDGGVFHKLKTFGCVNGEMGKLVAVLPTKNVKILDDINPKPGEGYYSDVSDEELNMIVERYDAKLENLRCDEDYKSDGTYFVVVKVYDSDIRKDVFVLLRGRGRSVPSGDFCLSGTDLDNLALAYALTCHKMQGSQSQVVIMALESSGSPEFLNRNMLNTIITRSQGIVCCVGSILGEDSMLNRGRMCVSRTDSRDILSVMSGDIGWLQE